jgi:two-component system sporulation sensor kinase A
VGYLDAESLRFLQAARDEAPDALILAVSPATAWESALRALRLGADVLLRKPFYPDELRLTIGRLRPATDAASAEDTRTRNTTMIRMAKGLAHEINNPLTAISGWLQILAEDPDFPEKDRGTLAVIQDETRKIGAVVDRMLLLSGEKIPSPQRVSLNGIACRVVTEAEARNPNGARIAMRLPPEPPIVLGDPDQLQRAVGGVLYRLMGATANGAPIRVETARAGGDASFTLYSASAATPKLNGASGFDVFPAEGVDSAAFDLAICRRVVENHGGKVEVRTGKGTAVCITLPAEGRKAYP